MTVGRNERCPCGSGRKYKHCCLREIESSREIVPDLGVRAALEWLTRRFRDQIEGLLEFEFFDPYSRTEISEAVASYGPGLAEMLTINIGDFLLSDAIYERGDEEGRGIDWVLDHGPRLSPAQRAFMEALAEAPLRLYEVVAVRPGEGLELRDALNPKRSPSFVSERTASFTLAVGNMLGARVVRHADGYTLSGALFPLERMAALAVIDRVEHMLDPDSDDLEEARSDGPLDLGNEVDEAGGRSLERRAWGRLPQDGTDVPPLSPELEALLAEEFERDLSAEEEAGAEAAADEMEDDFLACEIRDAWLASLLPAAVPQLIDRRSGAPILLVEDDYDVVDACALERVMSSQHDVIGDASEGWSRLEQSAAAGPSQSILTTVNTTPHLGRVTLFHRTESAAEAGREWFESVAGDCVSHRTRRSTDPRDSLGAPRTVVPFTTGRGAPAPDLPPEVLHQVFEQVIHRNYANWCDETIPVLGDRTPRQLMSDAPGRERVRYLLRTYEQGEAEQADATGRAVVAYDFLWQALGLAREE